MKKQFPILFFFLIIMSAIFGSSAEAQTEAVADDTTQEGRAPEGQPQMMRITGTLTTAEDHIRALGALEVETRIEAARALRELRDPSAIPALTQTVRTDPSAEVRGWALRALWQTDPDHARAIVAGVSRTDADSRIRDLALQLVPEAAPTQVAPPPTNERALAEQWMQLQDQRRTERRRSGKPLRVFGWLTFGITYGTLLCIFGPLNYDAINEDMGWPLFIPLIGPVIAASFAFEHGWEEDIAFGAMMIVAAMAQTVGLALAILGHVRGRRVRAEQRRGVSIVPSGPGLSMVARF